jgi:hypothetical protein
VRKLAFLQQVQQIALDFGLTDLIGAPAVVLRELRHLIEVDR